jgi:uncharacterized protein (DUF302 family)
MTSDLIHRKTRHTVGSVLDRLEQGVREAGLTVFDRIDHAAGAASAGLTLRPTTVLIFGSPAGGTPLMQSAQTLGLDLPLRILAWEDVHGQVWVTFHDLHALAARHHITDRDREIAALSSAVDHLVDQAIADPRPQVKDADAASS